MPFPFLGDLPEPGIKPVSPALAGGFFTTEAPGKSQIADYTLWRANTILYIFLSFLKKKKEGNSIKNDFYWTSLINKKISSSF